MTLVLTELTSYGIAMAADSAVTSINNATGQTSVRNNAATKLQKITYLNAGASCWGLGRISGTPTDKWLANFIASNSSLSTLSSFATALESELNKVVTADPNGSLGFHLAGYEKVVGINGPSFYHIHDGPSTTLQQRGITVNPSRFNANHDMPPNLLPPILAVAPGWITRNGSYVLYAQIFHLLEMYFSALGQQGIIIPDSHNLMDRAEYLIFQIRTVSEIYRLSNLVQGIGGSINYLTISPAGIQDEGTR